MKRAIIFLVLMVVLSSMASASLYDNLRYYYNLDDAYTNSSNDPQDRHIFGNDGYTSGVTLTGIEGLLGQTYNLSATNGYIASYDRMTPAEGGKYSINFWMNKTTWTSPNEEYVFMHWASASNGLRFYIKADDKFLIDIVGFAAATIKYDPANFTGWHMISVTLDETPVNELKLYVDGVLVNESLAVFASGPSNTAACFGSYSNADCSLSFSFIGQLDEIGLWNNTVLTSTEISTLYNSGAGLAYENFEPTYIAIVKNPYNDSLVQGVNVSFPGGQDSLTNEFGQASFNGSLGNVSLNLTKTGYFNSTGLAVENETAINFIFQSLYSMVEAHDLLGRSIPYDYIVGVQGGKNYEVNESNTSAYPNVGTAVLNFSRAGWITHSFSKSVSALSNSTLNITGAYTSVLNVTAIDPVGGGLIENISVTIGNLSFSFNKTNSTTGLYALFNLVNGSYYYNYSTPGYPEAIGSVVINGASASLQINPGVPNSFNITIYDEQVNAPITGVNFTLEFISDDYAANTSTDNATATIVLTPGDYEIRYKGAQNTSDYVTPRSYFVTLTNSSFQNIRLYAIRDSESSFFLPVIQDETEALVEGALVRILRLYIEGNVGVARVVEMAKSDPSGTVVLRIEPNTAFYSFIVTSDQGNLSQTNSFKITTQTLTLLVKKGGDPLQSLQTFQEGTFTCDFPTDQTIRLQWLDDTNVVTGACLKVDKWDRTGLRTTVADSCTAGSTGTLIYQIIDINQTTYAADCIVNTNTEFSNEYWHIGITFKDDFKQFGLIGVFFTLLTVIFLMSIQKTSEGVIISAVAGILIMGLVGVIVWEWTAFIGLAIIGGLAIYLAKR